MRKPKAPSQNSLAMLEWLEQRRLDLIAAYRATLEAEGQSMTAEQLNAAVERWSEFALGRSRTRVA
jgi:hypothetical protein